MPTFLIVLICRITKHNSLVSSSDVLQLLAADNSVGDVSILGFDHLDDVHLFAAHSTLPRVEANSCDGLACNGLEINLFFSAGDFSHQAECF